MLMADSRTHAQKELNISRNYASLVRTRIVLFCSRRTFRIFNWGGGGGLGADLEGIYIYIYINYV